MALFGRSVVVDVGPEGGPGRRLEGLDVDFRVAMSRSSGPNEATIRIFNPAPGTVDALQGAAAVVRLQVGYDDENEATRTIFLGTPNRKGGIELDNGPPDRILTISAKDGGRAFDLARLNVAFATSTSARQVFDEIADALGLAEGEIDLDADVEFPRGVSLIGPAKHRLDEFASSMGREWFVRDQALYVVEPGAETGEAGVVFSAEAGNLIGSPKPVEEGLEITGLIAPSLRPGKSYRVESAGYVGDYIADEVLFEGSSGFAGAFYVRVTGRPRG